MNINALALRRFFLALSGSALVLSLLILLGGAFSQPVRAASPEMFVVTIPANSVVQVAVNGFCLNRGLDFPAETLYFQEVASAEIRQIIGYVVDNGYEQQNLLASQLAVWSVANGPNPARLFPSAEVEKLTATLAQNSASYELPTIPEGAISIEEALAGDVITAILAGFTNVSDPPYFGQGILVLENHTDQQVAIAIPAGMVFDDPSNNDVQDMGVYATNVLTDAGESSVAIGGGASITKTTSITRTGSGGEIVRTLVGPPGPRGPQGLRGDRGETGPQGAQGTPGEQGAAGVDGISCWDRNSNGKDEETEDLNRDGKVDVLDCLGSTGPEGPIGPPGKNAFVKKQRVSQKSPTNSQQTKLVSVECPSGTVATGGGASINSALLDDPYIFIQQSYPATDSSWSVSAVRLPLSDTLKVNWSVTAWAVCVE